MGFNQFTFYNFRNLKDITFETQGNQIFLVGENGQGKSNILEAVYLLCFGSSFRKKSEQLFIKHDKTECSVIGNYDYEQIDCEMRFTQKQKKRFVFMNGKQVRDRKEFFQNIPAIMFSHDDIAIVTGSPAERRKFFNQIISLYDLNYVNSLRRYSRVLKERNAAFKSFGNISPSIYNESLLEAGYELLEARRNTVTEFNKIFVPLFKKVSGLDLEVVIEYKPSWKHSDRSETGKYLAEIYEKEKKLKTTLSGPHRDDYIFKTGNSNFALTASTGQRRLLALLLRLAQTVYFNRITSRKPVLLFDDVLLELDSKRKNRILDYLPEFEQAFFTFLPDEPYHLYKNDNTIIYSVEDGEIKNG